MSEYIPENRKKFLFEENIDAPIESIEQDEMNRHKFIETIISALISQEKSIGSTIGLCGTWGSGKTSILNMVEEKLLSTDESIEIIRFNPWMISTQEGLANNFMTDLISTVQKPNKIINGWNPCKWEWRNWKKKFKSWKKTGHIALFFITLSSAQFPIFLPFVEAIMVWWNRVTTPKTLHDIKSCLVEELGRLDFPIVVMIDELDRLNDEEIREVMRLIKAVVDFPNISYLVAYDAKRVIEALSDDGGIERGQAYLEKIIQHPFPIPDPLEEKMIEIWRESVFSVMIASPGNFHRSVSSRIDDIDGDLDIIQKIVFPTLIKTVRDIKCIIGTFNMLFSMNNRSINVIDILCYSILLVKASSIVDRIKADPEFFTKHYERNDMQFLIDIISDSGFISIELAKDIKRDLIEKGKSDFLNTPIINLISFMFPRFVNEYATEYNSTKYNRIWEMKNLDALLKMTS